MSRTVELEDDAIERLEQARRGEESYSAVVRRCIPPRRTLAEVLKLLRSGPSLRTLDAADESVTRRRGTISSRRR